MSTTQQVTDEVWASVPEKKLPRVWAFVALAVVAALVVAAVTVVLGGYLVPRLWAAGGDSAAKADSGTFDLRFSVRNEGATDATITAFRTGAPWLTISAVTQPYSTDQGAGALDVPAAGGPLPATVPPGGSLEVRLVLEVDCDARTSEEVPILIDAESLAGSHVTVFQPRGGSPMIDSPSDPYAYQPWPVPSADWVCTPYVEPAA